MSRGSINEGLSGISRLPPRCWHRARYPSETLRCIPAHLRAHPLRQAPCYASSRVFPHACGGVYSRSSKDLQPRGEQPRGFQPPPSSRVAERRAGKHHSVPGARSTGKSTLLESVRQLNPHLEALWIKGGNSSRPFTEEMVRSLLSDVKHPAQTLLLVDDLQYLSAGVQNVLLERRGAFRAVFVTYTPWPRRASSRCFRRLWDARARFCSRPQPWRRPISAPLRRFRRIVSREASNRLGAR